MSSDLFAIATARQQLGWRSQADKVRQTMEKTNTVIGATTISILAPDGTTREGTINTLNKNTPTRNQPVDEKYFFTVPPTILNEGDTILSWENAFDWLVLNSQNTGEVVYHTTAGKVFDLHFGDTMVRGHITRIDSTTKDGKIIELPQGEVRLVVPKTKQTLSLIQADAEFLFDNFGYKITSRPNRTSSATLIVCSAKEYNRMVESAPSPPPVVPENFNLGWPQTFTSSEPTTWTITTTLDYVVNTQTDTELTITIPTQRNFVGKPIVISNHLATYTLYVE